MSRLIVKNLPVNVTDKTLKELFSKKGVVTDVQLKYTKDGKFRQFAFIGYKTEEQAKLAKSYFNQTCIDTCRIFVEYCANLGDSSKPRSWSKHAADSAWKKVNKTFDSKSKKRSIDSVQESDMKKENKSDKKKKIDKEENNEIREELEKHKDDPLFMEFFETHTSNIKEILKNDISIRTAEKSDADDDDFKNDKDTMECESGEKKEQEKEEEKIANKVISDLEYMETLKKKENMKNEEEKSSTKSVLKHGPSILFTVIVRGLGYKHSKKNIKQLFCPLKPKSIRVPPQIKGIAYVGFKTERHMKKALMKNKSFLDGKQILVSKYEQKTAELNKDSTTNIKTHKINVKCKKQEESLKDVESIAESGRIFIRNLTYTITEDNIRKLFEKYGLLTEVNLPVDRMTRKPKGFGTVTFMMPEHAIKAYTELDGSILDGRMLHLLPGKAKDSLENIDLENLTYKEKKEMQNKANANSSHNWNTLFLGQNAIADAVASTYNTTKEKVLEDGSKGMSAAVKLALGETQLAENTRDFLEENGVCLDAFNQAPKQRSSTIILVKNLPAQTKPNEIREMFAKHGELGRVVMPPVGVTALVEFLEPSEARQAFRKLAYTKYKYLPLYLEWAPDNSFITPASKTDASKKASKLTNSEIVATENVATKQSEEKAKHMKKKRDAEEDNEEPEPDTTLFVKNINFSTTTEQLKNYFGKCGHIHYVTIATKKDLKNPGSTLSMGYGFVRYKRKKDADYALKTLQMSVLDGKTLELKRSERTLMSDVRTARKKSKITEQIGTKILVRNIPFQATLQEVTELFKAFGELKAVRLPKKLVGVEKHKGFGFIEYYTKKEAKKAFTALCQSTHLYGRRLVLEWAQAEEGIDEIRQRIAKHFHQENPTKKFKKATLDPETVGLEEDEMKVSVNREF